MAMHLFDSIRQGLAYILILVMFAGFVLFLRRLYHVRSQMRGLPGPPHHPLLGHIPIAIMMSRSLPADVHPHHYWHWLRQEYNLGPFFYFDVWPIGPPTLIICDADVADQVTVKNSLDKHPMVRDYLKQHLGLENMAAANGAVWKRARTVYNPGFATLHLMVVVKNIVDDVVTFCDILGQLADGSESFDLEAVAMKLSFDVIGRLVLDMGLNSQRSTDELVDAFRTQLHYLSSANTWSSPFMGLNFLRNRAIDKNSAVIDRCLGRILDSRYAAVEGKEKLSQRKHSMLDVALQTYNAEYKQSGTATMDNAFRQMCIDQIRTFVFAGHDTISTTIAMMLYYLSKNESAQKELTSELDAVLAPTSASAASMIRKDPYVLNSLPYTTAVVKETLRLFPPANTVRIGSPSVFITDPSTGTQFPTNDWVVWPDSYVIGRDSRYFPQPSSFIPERWIAGKSEWPMPPPGAFRAFERGPRNCIGTEFGILEVKVVLALAARDFEFVPGYSVDSPQVDGEPCYQMLFGSAKPKGSVPGTIKRRKRM